MKVQFDFKERIKKYGLILMSIYIKDKQAVMLVDTGSIGNVIDINFVKDLDIDLPTPIKSKMSGFNSCNEFEYSELIINDVLIENVFKTNIDFKVLNLEHTIKTFSDDYGIKFTGILGSDFLNKNKIIIDYKNKKIIYESNN